jgi:hypothetical protein
MRNFVITMIVLALAGCSDPKAASEKNFKSAMQNYLDTAYPHCYFESNFPVEKAHWDVGGKNVALAALEKAGLLSVKEVQQEEKQMFSQQTRMVTKLSYDLTAEGKKYYKVEATKNFRGETMGALCAGKASVKSIGQFTEPAEMMGQKISRVNYEYTVTDLPAWAMRPDLQQAIGGLKADAQSTSTPIKGVVAMVLTNNGWVHEKMFSR